MELRCKVFRAAEALDLEEAINRFLHEELIGGGEIQFEEITQSEGPGGVTIVVWYSISDSELMEEEVGDEIDGGEPRELA